MPMTVFGDNTAPLILPHDEGKPNPRTLRIAFLSKREIRQWQGRRLKVRDITNLTERDAAYDALLTEVVRGWDNIAATFSVEAISDHYSLPEVMMILELIPMAMVPGVEDQKK